MSNGEVLRITSQALADLEHDAPASPMRLLMEIASRSPDFTEEQMAGVCSAIYEARARTSLSRLPRLDPGNFCSNYLMMACTGAS